MGVKFLETVDLKRWQVVQDYFAEVIGAGIRVVDATGAPLTDLSNPPKFLFEVVAASPMAFMKCKDCLLFFPQPYSGDKLLREKNYFLDTPTNIHYDVCDLYLNRIIIPIRDEPDHICAYILIGPVILGRRRTYPEYFNTIKDLGLEINSVIDAIERVKVFSFNSIKSVVSLFQEIANFMVESGKDRLEAKKQNKATADIGKKEVPFYINKMLQALFETAGEGVNAEQGSVMVVNEDSKTLSIKLSKGLPQNVINSTTVKLGEGLAGWVAQEDKVLLVDKNLKNPRLLSRLHKPELKASLMVPIKTGDVVFGVLSLSTEKENHNFTQENINSIIQLTKMVDTALCNIAEKTRV